MKKISDSVVTLAVPVEGEQSLARFGLPCPKSAVFDAAKLRLSMDGETMLALPAQIDVLSTWPDGSLRWVLCHVIAARSGSVDLCVVDLGAGDSAQAHRPADMIDWAGPASVTGNAALWQGFAGLQFCLQVRAALAGESAVSDATASAVALPIWQASKAISQGAVWQRYRFESVAAQSGLQAVPNQRLNVTFELGYCPATGAAELSLRAHNPGAAAHPGGCWDLGDAGSHYIEQLSLSLRSGELGSAAFALALLDEGELPDGAALDQPPSHYAVTDEVLQLRQTGSGGEHWQSPVHWDEHKRSTVMANGFELLRNGEPVATGARARPCVVIQVAGGVLVLEPQDFWQNFPMTLSLSKDGLTVDLFPQTTELCGGESKTWRFNAKWIAQPAADKVAALLANPMGVAASKPVVTYSQTYLNACQILPHIQLGGAPSANAELIAAGLVGPDNFFAKRERVDEYGWRDYGDLWADHECHGLEPQPYFISHYNNQYDPLMGMTLQYLQQARPEWLSLVVPLSQHIQDIDIYDTEQDKAEYNDGLFWHTNHYLPAETCAHRSYSKHHTAVYQDFQGGGGPGGQHCYTTGLALQYFLFGDERAKQKVIQLTKWVRHFYNGNGTLLDRTFRFLTIDTKQNVFTNIGIKAPGYRYPLDRGTGNYLNALIDCFDVTSDGNLLKEAGEVIRNTCHPAEDIELRNLKDIENSWFYTVFFQAVARYLFLKEALGEIDQDYWHARHSLLHYGEWMLENEAFYLDSPEKLEFPNDTWCAQDIRKANLFCFMYYFAAEERPEYLLRAEKFYTYITERLRSPPEAHYTRLLALLMQNDGVQQKFFDQKSSHAPRSAVKMMHIDFGQPPTYKPLKALQVYCKDMLLALCRLSIKREIAWLKLRLR